MPLVQAPPVSDRRGLQKNRPLVILAGFPAYWREEMYAASLSGFTREQRQSPQWL